MKLYKIKIQDVGELYYAALYVRKSMFGIVWWSLEFSWREDMPTIHNIVERWKNKYNIITVEDLT
jgi:hypothetical protein